MGNVKAIMEAVYEALRLHDDGLLMASDREWIKGMVLKDVKRILTEQLGESEPFLDVDLEDVLRADADGMPIFRRCFEHECLMSFNSDDGNYNFRRWWHVLGSRQFQAWLDQQDGE